MQTFLPYPMYRQSAKALDNKRLGKQRVETYQILSTLTDLRIDAHGQVERKPPSNGWKNHPAVRMWRGHELSLLFYQLCVCETWRELGFKDTCLRKSEQIVAAAGFDTSTRALARSVRPPWMGNPEFHRSHQSNLVKKDPQFYGPQFPDVPPTLEYVWPV